MTSEIKTWTDPQGRIVPDHLVTDADRMKHDLAISLAESAEAVQAVIRAFKKRAFEEMYAAKDLIFGKYGAKVGGKKGGFGFRSYDGSVEVRIDVAGILKFGTELQAAKVLIDECIASWAEGADPNIIVLINDAFQVNKAGRIDTRRVLGLRRLPIKDAEGNPDERWARAMDAISDAVIDDETASYFRAHRRNEATGQLEHINLDFSSL